MNQAWRSLVNSNVKELRFILSQTSTKSVGIKNWLNKNFVELKKANPDTLFLIRECRDVDPIISARYDYGAERKFICEYASQEEVEDIVSKLVLESEKINSSFRDNKI
jgi:NADH dehydrogenase (ubiquinone) 1 alpha subcomplex subunit 2